MILPSNRVRIMVATKPVDFRKGPAKATWGENIGYAGSSEEIVN